MVLYYVYADIARIPYSVSEPMVGAIRLQWWRDLLDQLRVGETLGAPIGAALLGCHFEIDDLRPLIDGREAAIERHSGATLPELEAEAEIVGPCLMRLAARATSNSSGYDMPHELAMSAGTGFELLRLTPPDGMAVAHRASAFLREADRLFGNLPRAQRKQLLPILLPVGLAKRHARLWPQQKSLLSHQLYLLRLALFGRL